MRKFYIQTQGCQMNEYDSARLADLLRDSRGMEPVDSPEEADLLLLNTCAIREKAQEKTYHQLGRWRRLKQQRPDLIIGVGGCVASQEGEAMVRRARQVDLVFGPQTLQRLPGMLDAYLEQRIRLVDVTFPEIEKFDRLPDPQADGVTAFVSIMEGCSKYCSFCVVPYTRGEELSRPVGDVLAEVEHLAAQGVREVNLLGQNVNAYRAPHETGGTVELAELIEYVALIPGIGRIRFTTSHPAEFCPDLSAAFGSMPTLADHVHLPVQSGSDRILGLMKRGYTVVDYLEIISELRKQRPQISVSSDFIVGFPGETDEDFAATMALIEEVGFDSSFSFVFSPRPGTPAAALEDDLPMAAKLERLRELQRAITRQADAISQAMVGTRQEVLITGRSARNPDQLQGRSSNNKLVNFACPDVDSETQLVGSFAAVEIVRALPHSLLGELPRPGAGEGSPDPQARTPFTAGLEQPPPLAAYG